MDLEQRKEELYKKIPRLQEIEIEIKDSTNPTIILKSSETLMHVINTKFVDPGYTANDNYDGDLTNKVKTNVLDDFISYEVVDSSGNIATIKRTLKNKLMLKLILIERLEISKYLHIMLLLMNILQSLN